MVVTGFGGREDEVAEEGSAVLGAADDIVVEDEIHPVSLQVHVPILYSCICARL